MSLVSNNLKALRKKHQYTQEQFAEKLEIKRSLLGAYEEARAKPRVEVLIKVAEMSGVSVDDLLGKELFPEQRYGTGITNMSFASSNTTESMPSNKPKGTPLQAPFKLILRQQQSDYFARRHDQAYYELLPDMVLPTLTAGQQDYRAFEVTDQAMFPVTEGMVVVGKKEEDLQQIKSGQCYIVVSRDGLVVRKVYNQVEKAGTLKLQANNAAYPEITLSLLGKEVEVWEVVAYISHQFPQSVTPFPAGQSSITLQELSLAVQTLQQEVAMLKKSL